MVNFHNKSSEQAIQIEFTHIVKSYGKRKKLKTIIDDVDLSLNGGECALLTGKNGCGKSTLLRIMAGLLKPDSGSFQSNEEIKSWKRARRTLRQRIMYLYQEPYMFDGSVYHNLKLATSGQDTVKQVNQALEWADLIHRKDTEAKCLSGGERQRVALAQAWLKQPDVLLLDEPTANMDDCSRRRTEELLCRFKETGTALLVASHDVNHFHHTMDKRLAFEDGKIVDVDIAVEPKKTIPYHLTNIA